MLRKHLHFKPLSAIFKTTTPVFIGICNKMDKVRNLKQRKLAEQEEKEEPIVEKITLYFSTVPGNHEMRKGQTEIESALQGNKIDYEIRDVAASERDKVRMRSLANDQRALPPQIVNGQHYCGDYDGFAAAMETKTLGEFLRLKRKLDLSI